jgi:hypothetical protein
MVKRISRSVVVLAVVVALDGDFAARSVVGGGVDGEGIDVA